MNVVNVEFKQGVSSKTGRQYYYYELTTESGMKFSCFVKENEYVAMKNYDEYQRLKANR